MEVVHPLYPVRARRGMHLGQDNHQALAIKALQQLVAELNAKTQ
jgi:hypothetical protein